MDKGAVQFTYVMTSSNYRGRGLAWQGIYKAYNDLKKNGINQFWYITDSENLASQRLAEKMGFELVGKLEPTKRFFGIIKTLKLNENK
jgi:RimJ/RimL family protein N-acetyltransferase